MVKKLWSLGLLLVALAGCDRGGVELTGPQAVVAPEVPSANKLWVNKPARLADLRGQVVLVEAWHPS